MSHDLLAELAGYTAELAAYERQGRTDRAGAVRGEIDRVIGEVLTRIERLLTQAEAHEDDGQELLAAQARVEAKRLAAALPAARRPARLRALHPEQAGAENVIQAAPAEKAVPRRKTAKDGA